MAVKKLIYVFLALILTACHQQPYTVQYLLENPNVLEKELVFCMSGSSKSMDEMTRCRVAVEAQEEIKIYLEVLQEDPEKFGQRILDVEMSIAQQSDLAKQRELKILLAVVGLNSPE